MNGSNFMQCWVALTSAVAMVALILTAFGLMLGIVKPADVFTRVAAIVGVIMLLSLLPAIILGLWSDMSIWRRFGLAAIVFGVCLLLRPRRGSRND